MVLTYTIFSNLPLKPSLWHNCHEANNAGIWMGSWTLVQAATQWRRWKEGGSLASEKPLVVKWIYSDLCQIYCWHKSSWTHADEKTVRFGFNHFTTPFSALPGDVVTELGTCTCLGIQGLCSAIEPQSFPELWLCPIPTYKYNDSWDSWHWQMACGRMLRDKGEAYSCHSPPSFSNDKCPLWSINDRRNTRKQKYLLGPKAVVKARKAFLFQIGGRLGAPIKLCRFNPMK